MKNPLKLNDMDFDRLILTIVASVSITGIIGGIKAIINQASKNADFDRRLRTVESDLGELMRDVKNLLISDARKTEIMISMNKNIESVSESTKRIHQRMDGIPKGD